LLSDQLASLALLFLSEFHNEFDLGSCLEMLAEIITNKKKKEIEKKKH